jgi:pyridinium-3,5-bisthiocarboxylic acid mononucleotide nickel chelatase
MRIAYLDCFSGISGDMFLGALLDAGLPASLFQDTIAALNVGVSLEISRVVRSGIAGTKADVVINGEKDLPLEMMSGQSHGDPHEHAHSHHHDPEHHGHTHAHEANRAYHHDAADPHGRSLPHIRELITNAAITATAKQRAIAIFEALGAAEAKIHQVPIEKIHFHEVGAADAIVDIVCAAVGSDALGVDEWVCSPLNVGGGLVECAHGTFPVPAPATVELLKQRNAPMFSSGIQAELVTPTGAAIVSVLANRFGEFPAMQPSAVGYGAGYRELDRQPNVLRLTVGEAVVIDPHLPETGRCGAPTSSALSALQSETVTVLEANIDDLNPQVFGYLVDRALAEGAMDIFTAPVQMKKSRSGVLLTVLCNPRDRDKIASLIFAETTTLGVRIHDEQRYCLARRHVAVETPWGEVRIKLGSLNGTVTNYQPEYEDCRRLAEQHKIPLKTVMQQAIRRYLERHHE